MRRRGTSTGEGLAVRIGAALALAVFAGCGATEPAGYDPQTRFPLRTDPIVVKLPPAPPADLHANGRVDEAIADLSNRGGTLREPAKLAKAEREPLERALEDLFGTPAAPKLPGTPADKLALGSTVYKARCAQCHGLAGDGRGPTGIWVYPHPRDFRLAKFKYVSSTGGLPTRDDLVAMVKVGIAGNSMPNFALLPPAQLDAVVDYTLFLSLRGRVETDLLVAALSEDGLDGSPDQVAKASLARWTRSFAEAESKVARPVVPPIEAKDAGDAEYDASVRRGFAAFVKAGCASCHKDYGRETHYVYDDWGVAVRPANLSAGSFRAGGEPIDLFRRIRCGIPPSGMPAVDAAALDDAATWDLVRFLLALPVPRHLPDDVRVTIYK